MMCRTIAANRVPVSYRGAFAYVTGVLPGGETIPLCRLRYGGSARSFGFAIYSAARDRYQDAVLRAGRLNRAMSSATTDTRPDAMRVTSRMSPEATRRGRPDPGQHLCKLRAVGGGKPQPEPTAREGRPRPDEPHRDLRCTMPLSQPLHTCTAIAGNEKQLRSVKEYDDPVPSPWPEHDL